MRVAVSAASMEEVGCVQVKAHGDDLPVPSAIRSQVITTDRGLFIEITTLAPISDPALELVVTAGCSGPVSREYVLLLDPPPLIPVARETPSEAIAPPQAASEAPRPVTSEPPRARRPVTTPLAPPRSGAGAGLHGTPGAPPVSAQAAPPPKVQNRTPPPATPAVATKSGTSTASSEPGRGDALRVTPAQPLAAERPAAKPAETPPAAVTSNLASTESAGANGSPGAAASAAAAGSAAGPNPAAVREQELEKQLQLLSTQVEALQLQMQAVSERNRELESRSPKSLYTWLLGALALVALALAAWFGWSYRNLQRRSAARPWFEQTQMGPVVTPPRPASRRESEARDESIDEPEFTGTDGIEATEMLASDPFGGAAALVRPPVAPVPGPSAPVPTSRPFVSAEAEATERAKAQALVQARIAAQVPPLAPKAPPLAPPPAPTPVSPPVAPPELAPLAVPPEAPLVADSNFSDEAIESLLGISTVALQRTNPGGTIEPPPSLVTPAPAADAGKKDQRPLEAILDIDLSKTEAAADLRESVVDAMNPLDFELPALNLTKTEDKGPAEAPGAQRIMRTTTGFESSSVEPVQGEHASVQFRLTQFASVVDRAKEMQRSGDPTKAIALLREYVLRDDLAATMVWLMLFDLYRQVDKKPVYDALAENFERRYKRPMVPWKEPLTVKTPQSPLALNQELDLRINALWGTHEGIELLRDLTCGVDQPDRIVFNAELQRDLLQLAKVFPIDDTE